MANIKNIEIEKIIRDDQYYPRIKPNWLTIYNYRQSLQSGSIFPPIEVVQDNGSYVLIDGAHRLEAYKAEKRSKIKCKILNIPKEQWYEEAIKSNIANALPFSPYEKRRIVVRLREIKYSDNKIAEILHMPLMRLDKFLSDSFVKTDLRNVVVKSPLKRVVNEDNITDDLELHQTIFNARSPIAILDQFIELLANNWLDYTNEGIALRISQIKKLLSGDVS